MAKVDVGLTLRRPTAEAVPGRGPFPIPDDLGRNKNANKRHKSYKSVTSRIAKQAEAAEAYKVRNLLAKRSRKKK